MSSSRYPNLVACENIRSNTGWFKEVANAIEQCKIQKVNILRENVHNCKICIFNELHEALKSHYSDSFVAWIDSTEKYSLYKNLNFFLRC